MKIFRNTPRTGIALAASAIGVASLLASPAAKAALGDMADLSVAVTGASPVTSGTAGDYTVTVHNAGPGTADTVAVAIYLDDTPQVSFVQAGSLIDTASPVASCPLDSAGRDPVIHHLAVCTLGPLASGGNATITVRVAFNLTTFMTCEASRDIHLRAVAHGVTSLDLNPVNNLADRPITVQSSC